jgi:MbtH protein
MHGAEALAEIQPETIGGHMSQTVQEEARFVVVMNSEEQYALWADGRAVPRGWDVVHGPSPKSDCVSYVERVWTDITPLSARR